MTEAKGRGGEVGREYIIKKKSCQVLNGLVLNVEVAVSAARGLELDDP